MVFYRPGVGYLGEYTDADVRRWEFAAERQERCEKSPACMLHREISKHEFKHCWGSYQHYNHEAIINVEMDSLEGEPQLFYGYTSLIRMMFVLPECRGRGVAKEMLYHLTRAADKTGCVLTAVCRPVEWSWSGGLDEIRGSPPKERTKLEQCKYVGEMFERFGSSMKYLDEKDKETRSKQRRQRQRFLDSGFQRVLIPESLSNKNRRKLSHWTVAYVPQSCPQVMRDFIEPRLR